MRLSVVVIAAATSFTVGAALAKLPPQSDEAKAKAAETASKAGWTEKVAGYQLCRSMDRVAVTYRARASPAQASRLRHPSRRPRAPTPARTCRRRPRRRRPSRSRRRARIRHPATATTPPSNKATSAEMTGPRK